MDNRQLQNFPLSKTSGFKLGEVQGEYNAFAKALTDEQLYTRLQPYALDNVAAEQSLSESITRVHALQ